MFTINENYGTMLKRINIQTEDYIKNNQEVKAFVIGLSGGIDSAITAALATLACPFLPLIGLSMPSDTNTLEETNKASAIGLAFCTDYKVEPINMISEVVIDDLPFTNITATKLTKEDKIRRGNVKARLRMIKLYDAAQMHKGLVLSTDNYTEYLLGFWTLHGDVGDLGFIQKLFKTEVYGLATYLANSSLLSAYQKQTLKICIEAKPTDGLGISDNDLEQIDPYSNEGSWIDRYKKVDNVLIDFLNTPLHSSKDNPVIQRHLKTEYKRHNPYNYSRNSLITR